MGSLHYRAPAVPAGIASKYRDRFATVLDLVCGTGLAAETPAALGETAVGIDLSAAMPEKARRRGVYAELVKIEAADYLTATANRFDLIFAADVLITVGDLEALFTAASAALSGGGLFVFGIETTRDPGFELRPSGRFAHSRSDNEAMFGDDFTVLESGGLQSLPVLFYQSPGQGCSVLPGLRYNRQDYGPSS